MVLIMFTGLLCISGSMVSYAQTSTDDLQNIQQELEQKAKEKESVNQEIENIQHELESLNTYVSENKEAMEDTQKKISATNQLIDEKKEEIVILEDKILARKGVMQNRLVALQHDDNLSLVVRVFLESKSFDDFVQRSSAVTALFNADKNILESQQKDLRQIEEYKKEIDRQQQSLEEEKKTLAKQQAELNENLQKRQENLTVMQEKYSQINQQTALAQQEKAGIEAQLKAAQEKIAAEEKTAAEEKIRKEQEEASKRAAATTVHSPSASEQAGKGEEMYVTATAYSPEESGDITKLGYNIKQNPNMKLIAVDPSVIPLGKKVWVEGYGEAVAGDTGGAISGHKIDVLVPTKEAALSWGRKTVKIVILN
jgi:3D (Asp-Asp-Asp) domain-containing protein